MSGESHQKFREQKHASFGTPSRIWKSVIFKNLHIKIATFKRLTVGESNEVYEATSDHGGELFIRISHSKTPNLYREKWAMEACRKVGVPTPEILLLTDISDSNNRRTLCVEEKMHGVILKEILEKFSIEDKKLWVKRAGKLLSTIHSISPRGFGWIDENGKGEYDEWGKFMQNEFLNKGELFSYSRKAEIEKDKITFAFTVLKEHENLYKKVKPHLLHGDYGPKHLFVDKNKITGVIDMEHAISGDPANDFAWWNYFRGDKLPIEWLKEGYTDKTVFDGDFELRMHLCELSLSLSLILYYSEHNNVLGMNHTRQRFLSELKYFNFK